MTLREECDAAEVVWGRLLDRQDQLRLLALSVQAAGKASGVRVTGLEDFEPKSARLTEALRTAAAEEPGATVPRELEVLSFVAATREG